MSSRISVAVISFLFIILFSNLVLGLGVSPASVIVDYDDEAGLKDTYDFTVISNSKADYRVTIELEGGNDSIRKFASVSEDEFIMKSGSRTPFSFTLNIPSGMEDEYIGPQGMSLLIRENALSEQAGISVTTAVRIPVKVSFAYPGQYLEITQLQVSNINRGERALLDWRVESKGKERSIYTTKLEVFSAEDGSLVLSREYAANAIEPDTGFGITDEILYTQDLVAGSYRARLNVSYSNISTVREAYFNVGKEDVLLVDFQPKNFTQGEINEVSIIVRNLWNGDFQTYAVLDLAGTSTKTTMVTMGPFADILIKQFADTRSLPVGSHAGNVTVFYGNNSKQFPVTFDVVEVIAPPKEKTPPNVLFIAFVGVSVLLLVMILVLLLKNKKK